MLWPLVRFGLSNTILSVLFAENAVVVIIAKSRVIKIRDFIEADFMVGSKFCG